MRKSEQRAVLVAVAALVLALYPAVVSYLVNGISACFSAFAADAFYYLTVAKNASWSPLFSFDTINPTNGFHPLWQVYLKCSFSLVPGLTSDDGTQVLFTYWTCVACVGLSAALLSLTVLRLTRNACIALVAVVPGILYFPFALSNQRYGSLWSYMDGMESAFSLLLSAILSVVVMKSRIYAAARLWHFFLVAVLVSLLVLTRLDDVFLAPAFAVPLLWTKPSVSQKFQKAIIVIGVPGMAILAYCAFNLVYVGTALPVSGRLKMDFGNISNQFNLFVLGNVFLPSSALTGGSWQDWRELAWRALHNLVPAAIALGFLCSVAHRAATQRLPGNAASFLASLCLYVLAKAAYNFVLVPSWNQGHWYYPLSIVTANMILAVWMSRKIRQGRFARDLNIPLDSRLVRTIFITLGIAGAALLLTGAYSLADGLYGWRRMVNVAGRLGIAIAMLVGVAAIFWHRLTSVRIPIGLITVLCILYAANAMMAEKADSGYGQPYWRLWNDRQRITEEIRHKSEGLGILAFDDGIVAYSLDLPVMSGLGFSLDAPAMTARQSGTLLDIAYQRGFRWLTALPYMPLFPATIGDDVSGALRGIWWLAGQHADRWTFRLTYIDPTTGCKFIEFSPKMHLSKP